MDKCMNLNCQCIETNRWMTGWLLEDGTFARLCFLCGSAYESSRFCEEFHKDDSGWRNCRICGTAIHCGCIASKHTYECLDFGGIWCNICRDRDDEQCARMNYISSTIESSLNGSQPTDSARIEGITSPGESNILNSQDPDNHTAQCEKPSASSSIKQHDPTSKKSTGHIVDSIASQKNRESTDTAINTLDEEAKDSCNHRLLARYMPKVSNAELQLIFGALNATVTPLFEKVLFPSDVGRLNRLILPKVCAVTYFPYIKESSGMPIDVLDSNGKNWTFQLRYWNNYSGRIYVFENVQGYICEMGLEAQDTVIFGMIHPNKLVIGFKKIPRDNHSEDSEIISAQAHNMLKPDPESDSSFVMIDGYTFEVYDKPPIFGHIPESIEPVPGPSSVVSAKRVKRA